MKLKREDVGLFNPTFNDLEDQGKVKTKDGKNVVYTDVQRFVDNINTILEDDPHGNSARQIIQFFPTLLEGSADAWWTDELSYTRRAELRIQGLQAILNVLLARFQPDRLTATRYFKDTTLHLRDLAANEQALSQYIQKKMRWARCIGLAGQTNGNWQGAMMAIWDDMDLAIQHVLLPPSRFDTYSEYMHEIEHQRALLYRTAVKKYPYL